MTRRFLVVGALVCTVVISGLLGCSADGTGKVSTPAAPEVSKTQGGTIPTPVAAKATQTTSAEEPSAGQEIFTLGEVTYKEHPSAKGRINVNAFRSQGFTFYQEGKRYFYPSFYSVSNQVLDFAFFIEWKDASGLTIAKDVTVIRRLLPNSSVNPYESAFPEKAVSLLFWVEAKTPDPIPSEMRVKYVEVPTAKGEIAFAGWDSSVEKKGTLEEHWQLSFRFKNTGQRPLWIDANYRVNERETPGWERPGPTPTSVPGFPRPAVGTRAKAVGPGAVFQTEKVRLPPDATEVEVWAEVIVVPEFQVEYKGERGWFGGVPVEKVIRFLGYEFKVKKDVKIDQDHLCMETRFQNISSGRATIGIKYALGTGDTYSFTGEASLSSLTSGQEIAPCIPITAEQFKSYKPTDVFQVWIGGGNW